MVDLGTLPGTTSSSATGMNNLGRIVGWAADHSDPASPGPVRAFSWTQTEGLVELATLGGGGTPLAVNDVGQIVGESALADGTTHAVMWSPTGEISDLGGYNAYAKDVNGAGQVIGQSPYWRAFFWTATDGMLDIGSLGGYATWAFDLNESGQVVGQSVTADDELHAFSWTKAGGMVDLGTLGGAYSAAVSVNDSGQIVGTSDLSSDTPGSAAFLWTRDAGMIDLGGVIDGASSAVDINNAGQVVGESHAGFETHAFVWSAELGVIDLGQGGIPTSINMAGQVTGGLDYRAVLWNPQPYVWHGFFPPVDNEGVVNLVNAGRTVPVRFDLDGNRGLSIFAPGYPRSIATACSSESQDAIEQTVSDQESRLHYDGSVHTPIGQYTYVWRTDEAWAGSCRQLQLKLNDGHLYTANFRFR
jgi:probable HAF family extracellular repeat protein